MADRYSCTGSSNGAPPEVKSQTGKESGQVRRSCWECLRRRLVCDSKRPACNRCTSVGITCTGYSEQKPLRWLAPGKVKSKTRTRKDKTEAEEQDARPLIGRSGQTIAISQRQTNRAAGKDEMGIFNRDLGRVPRFKMHDFVTTVFEAAALFNTCLAPRLTVKDMWDIQSYFPLHELSSFPLSALHWLVALVIGQAILCNPDTERKSGILMSPKWARLHHHHFEAIRALNQELARNETRLGDATFFSIDVLLALELHQCVSPEWQTHYRGLLAFIGARGGFEELVFNCPQLMDSLLGTIIVGHTANSTSPPKQMLDIPGLPNLDLVLRVYDSTTYTSFPCPKSLFIELMRISDLRLRQALLRQDQGIVPALGGEQAIIDNKHSWLQQKNETEREAAALIGRIVDFTPTEWATDKDAGRGLHDTWFQLGNVYKAAMLIFATSSLSISPPAVESDGPAPSARLAAAKTMTARASHVDLLAAEIKKAEKEPGALSWALCWPAIALGVEAARCPPSHRNLVRRFLNGLSLHHGSALPLKAKEVLEQFWRTGKTDWNECFDLPYAFLT